jgi:hypothetical protein
MRLHLSMPQPCYIYILSLILIMSIYVLPSYQWSNSFILFIVSFIVLLYILKCYCKAIILSSFVVLFYIMGMNVREGMNNNDDKKEKENDVYESAIDLKKAKQANSKKYTKLKR